MEERFPTQPTGLILGRVGLVAILAGLLVAAWNGQIVIVTVLGLALAAAGSARLWSRFSLASVSCRRLLSEQRAFPGEHIELKLELSNRKLLPLPWVQVHDELPVGFAADILPTTENRPGAGFLSKAAALLWYSKVSWRTRLSCPRRGYYTLGPTRIVSGDIFGFYPRSVTIPLPDHIIVYPKILAVGQLGIPSLYPLGNTKAAKRIFEDPTYVTGVRDYNSHDSLRRIHWKATARQQSLQVKVFEPTTTLDVAIFLAVDSFKRDSAHDPYFENGISIAASIAKYVIDKGSPAGLFVNTRLADSGQPASVLPGSTSHQLVIILEALAKVTRIPSGSLEHFVNRERSHLPWGTTIVFIVYELSESLNILFTNLKEAGYKLLVCQVNKQTMTDARDATIAYYKPDIQASP